MNNLDGVPISEKDFSGFSYILSKEVIEINNFLSIIQSHDIINSNIETLDISYVYKSEWLMPPINWSYLLEHFFTFQRAFLKAAEQKKGIVISIG